MKVKNVLLLGGAGYIGTHAAVYLSNNNYKVSIVDNFSNSKKKYINRMEKITKNKVDIHNFDIKNSKKLTNLIKNNRVESVIHFAAFKSAEESMINPHKYYSNNINCTLSLLKAVSNSNCRNILFSSSACIYGRPKKNPIAEFSDLNFENVYGHTKLISEEVIKSFLSIKNKKRFAILRYFNPIGSHKSGIIGDDPLLESNNLMPNILKTLGKNNKKIKVYGNNYPTKDGTCIRDYIHIQDLVEGHFLALKKLEESDNNFTINLGTGQGYSVLDVINKFNIANNTQVDFVYHPKRKGDVDSYYSDVKKAKKLLTWKASRSLESMCRSAYKFYISNND